MYNFPQTIPDQSDIMGCESGFTAESGPLGTIHKLAGRDVGQVFIGFILGILVIMGLLWYRGGSNGPGFSTITSIFDFRRNSNTETTNPNLDNAPSGPTVQVTPFNPTNLRVKVNNLTLRNCAGFDCSVISTLPRGQTVTLLGERSFAHDMEWVRIRVGSQEGWVSRYFLE